MAPKGRRQATDQVDIFKVRFLHSIDTMAAVINDGHKYIVSPNPLKGTVVSRLPFQGYLQSRI